MIAPAIVAFAVLIAAIPLRPRRRRARVTTESAPPRLDRAAAAWAERRSRRQAPEACAVASWCDGIVRRVRSGSTLREALTEIPGDVGTAHATGAIRSGVERGLSISDAIARVDDAGPHLRLALGVLATTSRIGGPAAASIDRTAAVLRQRGADLEERATHAAQARLSTHVMTAVPLLMLAALLATDGDVRSVTASPIGAACIAAGLLLNATGWYWMHRIVRMEP